MKAIAILVVLVARSVAAEPVCKPEGAPIFEMATVADDANGVAHAASTVDVYDNGAWTRSDVDPATHKDLPVHTSCLAAPALATIRKLLDSTHWKLVHHAITCRARSLRHVIYRVRGTQIADVHVCGADALDDASDRALGEIHAQLGDR